MNVWLQISVYHLNQTAFAKSPCRALPLVLGTLLWVALLEAGLGPATCRDPHQPQPFCDSLLTFMRAKAGCEILGNFISSGSWRKKKSECTRVSKFFFQQRTALVKLKSKAFPALDPMQVTCTLGKKRQGRFSVQAPCLLNRWIAGQC